MTRKKNRLPEFKSTHQSFTLPVAVFAVVQGNDKYSTWLTNHLLSDVAFCSAVADIIDRQAITEGGKVGRVAHVFYGGAAVILFDGNVITVEKGGWQWVAKDNDNG